MSNARQRRFGVGDWRLALRKFIFWPWLALQVLTTGAFAADKLVVDLIPQGPRARNQSPIPVEARFRWDSAHLLEGRLEMEFHEGNRVLGRYRSGDLALTGGKQSFRMLLPPSLAPFSDSQVEVRMRFMTAGSAIELEPSVLSVPTAFDRSLVVGWCDTGTAAGELSSDLVRNLLLERFAPPANNSFRKLMMTSVVRLVPEDLPAQPLAYATFDIVVLTAEAFKEASDRQLQALARWVKGGGSVCVFVAGGLQAHQLRFLNELDDSAADGPRFLADDAGNLLPARQDVFCLHSGVGRSVIVAGQNEVETDSTGAAWRTAATFLWKLRGNQARAIADSGHWDPPVIPVPGNNQNPRFPQRRFAPAYAPFVEPPSYSPAPNQLAAELTNLLMPTTVRLIPFSALIGMLGLFLLLIGPADYFVLGFLRRRRFTWLLFPATSIAFTAATVLMADHYLGLRDQRRSLTVVDLARDGTALRWNRFELVFAARDKLSVAELKDALWAPSEGQMTSGGISYPSGSYYPYNRGYGYAVGQGSEVGPPLYEGTLPVHFQTSVAIRQWQPELNRIFSFAPPPVPLFPNWRAVEAAWPDLTAIRAKLSEPKPFRGDLYAFSGSHSITAGSGSIGILPPPVLAELCAGDSRGLLSLVSQISPAGGGNFEDLPAMDLNHNDSALVIVTRLGDDLVVYRRFFYGP